MTSLPLNDAAQRQNPEEYFDVGSAFQACFEKRPGRFTGTSLA
ncbi:MAG TPA: hypothetical protein VGO08_00010 [Burkholderiales bacterium]|nr:hypothetical protein [Burkholderiales bacterium]